MGLHFNRSGSPQICLLLTSKRFFSHFIKYAGARAREVVKDVGVDTREVVSFTSLEVDECAAWILFWDFSSVRIGVRLYYDIRSVGVC